MTRRTIRRLFRVNSSGNLIVRVQGRPPLELISDSVCPQCGVTLSEHTSKCGFFENMTLEELADAGYARWVEQI